MAQAVMTTDHEEIRRWAEERDGKPAAVKRTASDDDVGIIRIDFPGYSGEESLEHISWEEWFEKFEEKKLGLLVQHEDVNGEPSRFNKLVRRDAEVGEHRREDKDGPRRDERKEASKSTGSKSGSSTKSSGSGSKSTKSSSSSGSKSTSSGKNPRSKGKGSGAAHARGR